MTRIPGVLGDGSGTGGGDIAAVVQTGAVQVAKERAIAAFRHNIALPDVYVADRTKAFKPVVVGEDGAEMTAERRAELMKAAGVKPMFDADGKPTNENYATSFDGAIETERLGASAELNRAGIRVVQSKPVPEDSAHRDVGAATVASTEGPLHIPGTEAVVGALGQNCVFTTGHGNPVSPADFLHWLKEAILKMSVACTTSAGTRVGPKSCTMSPAARLFAQRYLKTQGIRVDATMLGLLIKLDGRYDNEIRIFGDPAYPEFAQKYASIFIPRVQYERAAKTQAAVEADTDVIVLDEEVQ